MKDFENLETAKNGSFPGFPQGESGSLGIWGFYIPSTQHPPSHEIELFGRRTELAAVDRQSELSLYHKPETQTR